MESISSDKQVFDGFYEAFKFIQNIWDEHGGPGDMWGPSISTQEGLSQQATDAEDSLPIPHGLVLLYFADPRNLSPYVGKPMPSNIMVSINPFPLKLPHG